jgi:hypothetical protein
MAVQAIMGAVFQEFGSSAAHRAFHLMVLPHLTKQLMDPVLVERAQKIREGLVKDLGEKILLDV